MNTIFKKDGYICYLERDKYETIEQFIDRGNFIVSQKPSNMEEYQKALTYSRIMVNVKYSGAKYTNTIMDILDKMLINCYKF